MEILAQRSYGGKARPISTPSRRSDAAKSTCGIPASKNTKLPADMVKFTFNSRNTPNQISRSRATLRRAPQ